MAGSERFRILTFYQKTVQLARLRYPAPVPRLVAMFRGVGDSRTPLLTVSIACAVNIAGDLALVGALGL